MREVRRQACHLAADDCDVYKRRPRDLFTRRSRRTVRGIRSNIAPLLVVSNSTRFTTQLRLCGNMTSTAMNLQLSRVLGEQVATPDGGRVKVAELSGNIIGLYFSAGWCGSCKAFSEQLSTFYENFQKNSDLQDSLNIILVSCDRSEAQFEEHLQQLSWCYALPFSDRARKVSSSY